MAIKKTLLSTLVAAVLLTGCGQIQFGISEQEPVKPSQIKPTEEKKPALQKTKIDDKENFCTKVPVFMYHHIKPTLKGIKDEVTRALSVSTPIFEGQMKHLVDNGYKTTKAEDLAETLLNHTELDKKTIILTFDDGYDNIYTEAFPIAKKYNVILNVMVITDFVGREGYMTWEQLKEMKNSGLVYIYNHTKTHPSLTSKTEEQIKTEVLDAKSALEKNIGEGYPLITYPYGSYGDKVTKVLKENGFKAGFSTIKGISQCKFSIFEIQRKRIGELPLNKYGF